MPLTFALLLAIAQAGEDLPVTPWASCAGQAAANRLDSPNPGPTERIADEAIAACRLEEQVLRLAFIRAFGPREGAEAFARFLRYTRERLILRVNQGRALRGR